MRYPGMGFSALAGTILALTAGLAMAASHSDAPLIKQDPQANITDVYAFIGTRYDDPGRIVLNAIVQVRPFSEPGDGPHYDSFAEDALYSIHVTDPSTGETRLRYDFRFSDVMVNLKNPDTIFSYGPGSGIGPIEEIGDAARNVSQTYSVEKQPGRPSRSLARDLLTAPPNLGARTTPEYNGFGGKAVSGASSLAALDQYTRQAIHDLPTGEVVFAGPRDDGFYADTPGIFDTLDPRILDNNGNLLDGLGQDGNGVDGFKGFNVLVYAIQIPVEDLEPSVYETGFFGRRSGVGVYASVSRRRSRILTPRGPRDSGPWVQVNRMGNPLFNELFVPLRDKDLYNRESPLSDPDLFAVHALNPEIPALINILFGTNFPATGRADLAGIFIPDVLRVAMTQPVRLAGQPGFHRLGILGGDTTTGITSGWPNGRRLGDDVVDLTLTVLANGPAYNLVIPVGDNVAANDALYNQVFPYAATPHSGASNAKD